MKSSREEEAEDFHGTTRLISYKAKPQIGQLGRGHSSSLLVAWRGTREVVMIAMQEGNIHSTAKKMSGPVRSIVNHNVYFQRVYLNGHLKLPTRGPSLLCSTTSTSSSGQLSTAQTRQSIPLRSAKTLHLSFRWLDGFCIFGWFRKKRKGHPCAHFLFQIERGDGGDGWPSSVHRRSPTERI